MVQGKHFVLHRFAFLFDWAKRFRLRVFGGLLCLVLVSINSDAHSINDYNCLAFGVGQARRGWLEKDDVLNTRPLAQLQKLLKKTMG